jgi:hypothetical protein
VAPRQPPAAAPAPQASGAPVNAQFEGETPEPPETPAEEAEQAQGALELCAGAGLAREGVNTPEEVALDRELEQSCVESGAG